MKTGLCKGCGEDIGWIMTKAGKWMPVEAESTTIMASDLPGTTIVTETGEVLRHPNVGDEGYEPHWAHCRTAREGTHD